ncbi:LVIVD repeat-containing protein [Sphingomonas sp. DT-207]
MDRRTFMGGLAATGLLAGCGASGSRNGAVPSGATMHNVDVVAYHDLDRRPGFKMTILERDGRWYLYTGCFWHRGWNIVEVTDPARPELVNFVRGPDNTFTLQVELADNTLITALEKGLDNAPWGLDPNRAFEEGVLLWDLADPVRPRQVGHYRTGGRGTHRNGYQGGRYMHLAAGAPGFDGNIYSIVDIRDRAAPREVGRWWVPGQQRPPGANETVPVQRQAMEAAGFCNIDGKDVSLHGPAVIEGTRAWLPYGAAGLIVLDISDVTRPRQIARVPFTPPFHSTFGVHGVLPVPSRGVAYLNSEDTSYGRGAAHFAGILDIRNPARPQLISLFPEPIPPEHAPYRSFSERPGWSGPHNINQLQHNPAVQRQGNLFYIAHFNAGLRIYDVSHPRLPREIGWFMPPDPVERLGPMPQGPLVAQTEDVLVDRRGNIFVTDKNQGLWVLRYSGSQIGV